MLSANHLALSKNTDINLSALFYIDILDLEKNADKMRWGTMLTQKRNYKKLINVFPLKVY